ncbi:MAG: MFS transporter [Bacteroidales bacterium]
MNKIAKSMRDNALMRWGMLLLVSFAMAANYYVYDALTPIFDILRQHLNFSGTDFGVVVGFYAFPNTFLLMAVLGGIILDRIGIRITGSVFVVFMVIGAWLTYYGSTEYYNSGGIGHGFMSSFLTSWSPAVKMMALGMLIFGLGAETGIVVFNKIIVKWFKGHEMALAFAVNLGIARFGTALAIKMGPRFATHEWNNPIYYAAILMSIGLVAFLVYLVNDLRLDKQLHDPALASNPEEKFRLSDVTGLLKLRSFLFITILCVTFYAAFFPFLKFAPDFFLNRFGVSKEESGDITFWLPMGTVIFTPIFGWFVDNRGKAASLMIFGAIIVICVHLLFAFTHANPYVMCGFLGVAFSLVPAAMWPSVARIVNEKQLGTAYGMMFSLQNLGLFAVPILAGYIIDISNPEKVSGEPLNYTYTMATFAIFGLFALLFAILLKRNDKKYGYGLNQPSREMKV